MNNILNCAGVNSVDRYARLAMDQFFVLCLSTKDNAGLNLYVYQLTTLTQWIRKRINKWCRIFLLLIKLHRRIFTKLSTHA